MRVNAWIIGTHVLPLGFARSVATEGMVLVQDGREWHVLTRGHFDQEYEWIDESTWITMPTA